MIALKNHNCSDVSATAETSRTLSEPLTQEICVCSRSHVASSVFDLCVTTSRSMWRNFRRRRVQEDIPDPDPPMEADIAEEEKSAIEEDPGEQTASPKKEKRELDSDEEQHKDPIKFGCKGIRS